MRSVMWTFRGCEGVQDTCVQGHELEKLYAEREMCVNSYVTGILIAQNSRGWKWLVRVKNSEECLGNAINEAVMEC